MPGWACGSAPPPGARRRSVRWSRRRPACSPRRRACRRRCRRSGWSRSPTSCPTRRISPRPGVLRSGMAHGWPPTRPAGTALPCAPRRPPYGCRPCRRSRSRRPACRTSRSPRPAGPSRRVRYRSRSLPRRSGCCPGRSGCGSARLDPRQTEAARTRATGTAHPGPVVQPSRLPDSRCRQLEVRRHGCACRRGRRNPDNRGTWW